MRRVPCLARRRAYGMRECSGGNPGLLPSKNHHRFSQALAPLVFAAVLRLKLNNRLSVQQERQTGLPLAGVLVFWAFISAAVITITSVGIALKSGKTDLLERTIWDIGWVGWTPLTFLVLKLCRKNAIDRKRKLPTIALLAGYGVGIVALQILFDFSCITVLNFVLRGVGATWKPLLYIAVYKAHIYYGVYWMIVGAAHALEFHHRFRESELVTSQLETKLATAELDRLKAQLQPHFLFNTHNTIVALMLKNENEAAIRMLTRLSDLLRLSLSRSGQQLVTVREELEALRMYLDIQRERFRDRLVIEIRAPDEVQEAEIPHLLLQPIVENALLHGLEDVPENAYLGVSVVADNDWLVCEVCDNGAGFPPGEGHAGFASDWGIGLSNTRERLQQLYASHQSLAISAAPGGGGVVTLRLPLRLRAALPHAVAS